MKTKTNAEIFMEEFESFEGFRPSYHGRFYYQGPAVDVKDLQEAFRISKVPCDWDTMGMDYIVYPKNPKGIFMNIFKDEDEDEDEDEE